MYEYVEVNGVRRPIFVGYINTKGKIIDVTRPYSRRWAGSIVLKEGRAVVRVFHEERDGKYDEIGWVDSEGRIFESNGDTEDFFGSGSEVGRIDPIGRRRWYELWLRCHADVPSEVEEPFGKCIEAIRFRNRPHQAPSILARAGAALLLYRRKVEAADETALPYPLTRWDTALPASMLFAALYFVPGVVQFFDGYYVMFPFLGKQWSYVLSMILLYLALWVALLFLKESLLADSHAVRAPLTLINRQTGILGWSKVGMLFAIIGVLWSYLIDAYQFFPLFLAILIGFAVSWFFAPREPWRIEPRASRPRRDEEDGGREEETENGGVLVEKEYSWKLDSFRDIDFETKISFRQNEIDSLRESNPFHQNLANAQKHSRQVSKDLVLKGERARQVKRIVDHIIAKSSAERLTKLEEVQAVLDFVQTPCILYALDEQCDEIGNPPEYFRWPTETLFDKRGDCDCKSVLAAALMRSMGYPVLLLISDKASHAAVAVGGLPDLGSAGDEYTIEYRGKHYYFCETTGEGWSVGQPSTPTMLNDPESIVDLTSNLPAI
jgi:hypothetical protein